MQILHVLDHSIPLHSGYTFRTRAILEQQRALGWETFHITGPKHAIAAKLNPPEEDVDGFHFYRTQLPTGMTVNLPVLSQIAIINALQHRLAEVVEEIKPDIIHAHSPSLNGEAAARVGKQFGIPVVYEIRAFWEDAAVDHGSTTEGSLRYRITRAHETRITKRVQAVTTICEGLRNDLVMRGIPASKITVIPNAVDVSRFQVGGQADPALLHRLDLVDKRVIGFIGSFYSYEGLSLLLDAIPRVVETRKDIAVLLVGGGPEEERLKTKCSELGISEYVHFTGRMPHDEIQDYYNLVDIFVYPRQSMRLTNLVTPLKPLEAMAQGRVVVASDVGGHKELIRDKETGILFKAGDKEALALSIVDLLKHPERWPELRQAGRDFVEKERTWSASVSRYQDVYAMAMSQKM